MSPILSARERDPNAAEPRFGDPGVLAFDRAENRVQCHVCGRWYRSLNNAHLSTHGLSPNTYKRAFGFLQKAVLEIPDTRAIKRSHALRRDQGAVGTERTTEYWDKRRRLGLVKPKQPPTRSAHWTDQQIVDAVRRFEEKLGRAIRREDLSDAGRDNPLLPSRTLIRIRFGSWTNFTRTAGLRRVERSPARARRPVGPKSLKQRPVRWTEEMILSALRALQQRLERPLRAIDVIERPISELSRGTMGSIPTYRTVGKRFGTWTHVCDRLDVPAVPALPRGKDAEWTREEILAGLRELRARTGERITRSLLDRKDIRSGRTSVRGSYPSYRVVRKHFGSLRGVRAFLELEGR